MDASQLGPPPAATLTSATPPGGEAVDPRRVAERVLDGLHGPRLSAVVDPGDGVAVGVTDVIHATPDDTLLSALVDRRPDPDAVSVVLGRFAPLAGNYDRRGQPR